MKNDKVRKDYTKTWYGQKTLEKMTIGRVIEIVQESGLEVPENDFKNDLIKTLDKNGFVRHFENTGRGRKKKEFGVDDLVNAFRKQVETTDILEKYLKEGKILIDIHEEKKSKKHLMQVE
jgi:ribosomal protein S8